MTCPRSSASRSGRNRRIEGVGSLAMLIATRRSFLFFAVAVSLRCATPERPASAQRPLERSVSDAVAATPSAATAVPAVAALDQGARLPLERPDVLAGAIASRVAELSG